MQINLVRHLAGAAAFLFLSLGLEAQVVRLAPAQYEAMKAAGTLPANAVIDRPLQRAIDPPIDRTKKKRTIGVPKGGGVNGDCDCWIAPDSSYLLAMTPNDDLSSGLINLPFTFNLYGDLYTSLYINNNGNVSFVGPVGAFLSVPGGAFPALYDTVMVAPFWADVDTRGDDGMGLNGGQVLYKVTPTAIYVNWVDVGYYSQMTDKKNTFQLILTDGTDPVIGVGKNVSFCYRNMDWTTGAASTGVNGFGGYPAIVGANRGNGIDYIQFGLFDAPGPAYDGPFGANDGIDWLDAQNFVFTTAVSTTNIPPIASSSFLCDTVKVCTGQLVNIDMNFLAPEQNQVIVASSTAATLPGYSEIQNTSGATNVLIQGQFTPTAADQGLHTITFTATDNGSPALTTTIEIVVDVFYTTLPPPVVTGDTVICAGQGAQLTVPPLYDTYVWSNGYNGNSVLVSAGTYSVQVTAGYCTFGSNSVTVTEVPAPAPVITGVLFNCGGAPTELGVAGSYASYLWSNGETTATTTVGTGTYSVTVTDSQGCTGASSAVNVLTAPDPTAFFTGSPNGPVLPGTTVEYTDGSNPNGASLLDWEWAMDGIVVGSGTSYSVPFETPGLYPIVLTVTTSDGCTDSYSYDQLVKPTEIFVPNVFSPNGDGLNDLLEFSGVEFYPNAQLSVYNRWGNEIYSSPSYRNTWQAVGVSEGTYYYVLKVDGKEYAGAVTLLR